LPFFIELERVLEISGSSKLAVSAIDLSGSLGVAAFAVRVMLLDQPLVGPFDLEIVGIGLQPKHSISGGGIGHRQRI
jgi:hypothetical protein